jgi:hypothetical protein
MVRSRKVCSVALTCCLTVLQYDQAFAQPIQLSTAVDPTQTLPSDDASSYETLGGALDPIMCWNAVYSGFFSCMGLISAPTETQISCLQQSFTFLMTNKGPCGPNPVDNYAESLTAFAACVTNVSDNEYPQWNINLFANCNMSAQSAMSKCLSMSVCISPPCATIAAADTTSSDACLSATSEDLEPELQ